MDKEVKWAGHEKKRGLQFFNSQHFFFPVMNLNIY